jgi:hypothetical protein
MIESRNQICHPEYVCGVRPISTICAESYRIGLAALPKFSLLRFSSRRSAADPAFWAATWDRLHGTLRLKIPQREITLGVPHWRTHDSVSPPAILAMPLQSFPRVWHLRGDGEPSPHVSEIPRNHLLPGAHRKTPVATATY